MKIREITDRDSKEVNKLYKELYQPSEPDVNLVGKKIDAEMISFLIEENGKVVGLISGTVVHYSTKIEGQIWDLIIDPIFRNRGYGKQLVTQFEKPLGI